MHVLLQGLPAECAGEALTKVYRGHAGVFEPFQELLAICSRRKMKSDALYMYIFAQLSQKVRCLIFTSWPFPMADLPRGEGVKKASQ